MALVPALIRELRSRGVKVGMQETVALAAALSQGIHESTLEGFRSIARALLIHDESDLDEFEQVFEHIFRGAAYASLDVLDGLREWLENPVVRPEGEGDLEPFDLTPEELRRMFEERLKEQTERHDGGDYWIGTGGRSPFGTGGARPGGISLGGSGGRSSIKSADPRRYRPFRHDLVLDVRQLEVALRRLRSFESRGPRTELDLERSIDETARNFGELELVFRRPRRPNTRVILMMDAGGSMDPYAHLVSQLFSAARRATHWKELRSYYFHNCVYGRVYKTEGLREVVRVRDLLRECDSRYELVVVGDASMAPYELAMESFPESLGEEPRPGIEWLRLLRRHFPRSIWLNPETSPSWRGSTSELIGTIFPMFPLTISGLERGLKELGGRSLK
jgi:uncharacterized protein with von Willebrand factor type A (vWA) domain